MVARNSKFQNLKYSAGNSLSTTSPNTLDKFNMIYSEPHWQLSNRFLTFFKLRISLQILDNSLPNSISRKLYRTSSDFTQLYNTAKLTFVIRGFGLYRLKSSGSTTNPHSNVQTISHSMFNPALLSSI